MREAMFKKLSRNMISESSRNMTKLCRNSPIFIKKILGTLWLAPLFDSIKFLFTKRMQICAWDSYEKLEIFYNCWLKII